MSEGSEIAGPVRISYGNAPSQFGDLWLPAVDARAVPLVILIHGGFWRGAYGLDQMIPLAADLVSRGYAVWNIEYRRMGEPGGGYPGTLEDVALAVDAIADVASEYSLDVDSTVVVGHSAGGQLALWSAGRSSLPPAAPGASPIVVPRLAIGLGPVFDLRAGDAEGLGGGAVTDFIGGSAAVFPERYDVATPRTAPGCALAVVRGTDDDIVPERFTVLTPVGTVTAVDVPGDHFELIDPSSRAWQAVIDLIER